MTRTYRRRGERHDYDWVLRDHRWVDGALVPFLIDARSKGGRRAIARFHSDACWTLRSTAQVRPRFSTRRCVASSAARAAAHDADDGIGLRS
jgi:hypothetical protein